jgi:phosphate transport system permease protein
MLLVAFMVLTALVVVAFVGSVVAQSIPGWKVVGLKLFTSADWVFPGSYGAIPLIAGTAVTTGLALLLAVPVGLGSAIAIVFLVPHRLKLLLSSLVGLLAVVPSIVYGVWGAITLEHWSSFNAEPWLSRLTHGQWPFSGVPRGAGIMIGSIVLAVMILPIITAVAADVIKAVPGDVIDGAKALGATQSQIIRKIVLPSCRSGLVGAVSLGTARALGETIALATLLGGLSYSKMPTSLLSTGSTLAAEIVTEFQGMGGTQTHVLFCLAVVLMVIVAVVSLFARGIISRSVRRFL